MIELCLSLKEILPQQAHKLTISLLKATLVMVGIQNKKDLALIINERDNFYSLKFIYKQNPKQEIPDISIYLKIKEDTSSYEQFIANLNNNGIGVNKIIKKGKIIGVDITQFIHPNVNVINEIIDNAKSDSSLTEEVLVNYKMDLSVIENYDNSFEEESEQIYIRNKQKGFNSSTKFNFRPFLASRKDFSKVHYF